MNSDQFVDEVYDDLIELFEKDKNQKKHSLGTNPILKIFDIYSDWFANNLGLSPQVAANAVYRDIIKVGYIDFGKRQLKRGVQLKGELGFNQIYGTQKQIDQARVMLEKLAKENPNKYKLVKTALEKIKEMGETIKPSKNIYGGKTTNLAKQDVSSQQQMPKFSTLQTLLQFTEKELSEYIKKFTDALVKK